MISKDRIRNKVLKQTVDVGPVSKKVQKRLRWNEHLKNREEQFVDRKTMEQDEAGRGER